MKNLLLLFLLVFVSLVYGYEKKSLVERYTNASCGPCAAINNAWYTVTTHDLVANNQITHIVYNVNWPGSSDPMYLLNATDNIARWTYYGVNSVPWIQVNGTKVGTAAASYTLDAVTAGNTEFSPFKIILTPEYFSNNVINVHVKIIRDITDTGIYTKTKLQLALTEREVVFSSPPGTNGEYIFYSISRKMLPDGKGTLLTVPAPGDSIEFDFDYVPTPEFLAYVNIDGIRVAAFIQNDETKYVYQSVMENIAASSSINASYKVDENLGAAPFNVQFTDYSSGSNGNPVTSWKWDFNNDGVIDATTQNPTYTYTQNGKYSVALTVGDGTNEVKRTIKDMVQTLGKTANTLVVNGLDYKNYGLEVSNFFDNSACFANHEVDIWDLFGEQGLDYSVNPLIKQVNLFARKIPNSILNLYDRVIWIGNNYSGDLAYFSQQQVVDYVQSGGHFLLATRMGSQFMNNELLQYCNISYFSSDLEVLKISSLDSNLVEMNAVGTNSLVHLVVLDTASLAVPIFIDSVNATYYAGFTIHKTDEGTFTFIAGRPYRYDLAGSTYNYNYIIDNIMTTPVLSVKDEGSIPSSYSVSQNYPNPFNPSTVIKYSLPFESNVKITIYNSIGQLIETLVDNFETAGNYSKQFNASKLASGVYFYTIQANAVDGKNNFYSSKKMLLLK